MSELVWRLGGQRGKRSLGARCRIGGIEGGQGVVLQKRVGQGWRRLWRGLPGIGNDRRVVVAMDYRATAAIGLSLADILAVRHLALRRGGEDNQQWEQCDQGKISPHRPIIDYETGIRDEAVARQ